MFPHSQVFVLTALCAALMLGGGYDTRAQQTPPPAGKIPPATGVLLGAFDRTYAYTAVPGPPGNLNAELVRAVTSPAGGDIEAFSILGPACGNHPFRWHITREDVWSMGVLRIAQSPDFLLSRCPWSEFTRIRDVRAGKIPTANQTLEQRIKEGLKRSAPMTLSHDVSPPWETPSQRRLDKARCRRLTTSCR